MLTKVEAAFRSLKTDLGVRPVYHQLGERTMGHLFISVLAYHLLICIEQKLIENGDHRRAGLQFAKHFQLTNAVQL
jgi:transposase